MSVIDFQKSNIHGRSEAGMLASKLAHMAFTDRVRHFDRFVEENIEAIERHKVEHPLIGLYLAVGHSQVSEQDVSEAALDFCLDNDIIWGLYEDGCIKSQKTLIRIGLQNLCENLRLGNKECIALNAWALFLVPFPSLASSLITHFRHDDRKMSAIGITEQALKMFPNNRTLAREAKPFLKRNAL